METILYVGLLFMVAFVAGLVGYEIRNFQLRREIKRLIRREDIRKMLERIRERENGES